MEVSDLIARIESLLSRASRHDNLSIATEVLHGAFTIMSAVYGLESHQVMSLREYADRLLADKRIAPIDSSNLTYVATGALRNLKEQLEAGLAGSLQKRMVGEVLTDFIQLARAALDETEDNAKNVAAVLASAAFEDTIRRMGATFAGVLGRDDLSDVIEALKNKGVLQSPQLGIALSYLNFRNRALHAQWEQIDRAAVHSVLGFVEQLLLKHFQ